MALHRYCPDHDPTKALCGIPVDHVADSDIPATAETMPWCVVCADLSEQACLTYSRERSL